MSRVSRLHFAIAAVATLLAQGSLSAQSLPPGQTLPPARGPEVPLLGFLSSDSPVSLRPIIGSPGAIVVGSEIALPGDVTRVTPAPGQRFAIVERSGSSELTILRLGATEARTEEPLSGTFAHTDSIAFSPSGRVALLYSASLQQAQVITGLPSGQVAQSLDLTPLNGVPVTSLAVGDDAQTALVGVSNGSSGSVWSFTAGQSPRQVLQLGSPVAMRFLAGSEDAVVADSLWQQVSLLTGGAQASGARLLAGAAQGLSTPSDLEISADQRRVWIADTSGSLLGVDLNSGATTTTASPFAPAKLASLAGRAAFLVTSSDNASSGVWVPASPSPASSTLDLWRLTGGGK